MKSIKELYKELEIVKSIINTATKNGDKKCAAAFYGTKQIIENTIEVKKHFGEK